MTVPAAAATPPASLAAKYGERVCSCAKPDDEGQTLRRSSDLGAPLSCNFRSTVTVQRPPSPKSLLPSIADSAASCRSAASELKLKIPSFLTDAV